MIADFAPTPTDRALPFVRADFRDPFELAPHSTLCPSNYRLSSQLTDLNGDGRKDLVLTDKCDPTGVGTSHWEVYLNEGGQFATAPISWALPSILPGDDVLSRLPYSSFVPCTGPGTFSLQLTDMNGDNRPDLLVTDMCDTADVGTTHWLVYANNGAGFETTASTWTMPVAAPADDHFARPYNSTACAAGGRFNTDLVDLDGDDKPDLVVTNSCEGNTVGKTHWEVFWNDGGGFSQLATTWSLPPVGLTGNDALDRIGKDVPCDSGTQFVTVLEDLDGDGRKDLVLLDNCDVGGVGGSHWLLHRNTGTGFGSASQWPLPAVSLQRNDPLQKVGDRLACAPQLYFRTLLTDVNADGRPDLLVTDNCDAGGVGRDRWLLHENTGAGFDVANRDISLPSHTSSFDDPFATVGWTLSCAGNEDFRAELVNMSGDSKPEIVILDDCDSEGVGTDRWQVYEIQCQ